MKKVVATEQFAHGLRALMHEGFDRNETLIPIQRSLIAGTPLHSHHRDHALRSPLKGYRACHVGQFKGRTIVLIYRDHGRRMTWESIGEHDDAYTQTVFGIS